MHFQMQPKASLHILFLLYYDLKRNHMKYVQSWCVIVLVTNYTTLLHNIFSQDNSDCLWYRRMEVYSNKRIIVWVSLYCMRDTVQLPTHWNVFQDQYIYLKIMKASKIIFLLNVYWLLHSYAGTFLRLHANVISSLRHCTEDNEIYAMFL